jgi:hypothetical protein
LNRMVAFNSSRKARRRSRSSGVLSR